MLERTVLEMMSCEGQPRSPPHAVRGPHAEALSSYRAKSTIKEEPFSALYTQHLVVHTFHRRKASSLISFTMDCWIFLGVQGG